MIDDKAVEAALDFLVSSATQAAQARATRIYLEEYRKSLKAKLMGEKVGETIGAQERYAYSHADYLKHLETMRDAIEADERYRWLLVAAEARIEAYRTMAANSRAQGKI